MAVIDIIKRFFSSGDTGFSVPARLGKDRMAGCVQEAQQIAETARRKRQEELDAERGVDFDDPAFNSGSQSSEVLKAIETFGDGPRETLVERAFRGRKMPASQAIL